MVVDIWYILSLTSATFKLISELVCPNEPKADSGRGMERAL